MSQTVIKVSNLSKLYRLGVVGTGTLSHDLNRWWYKVRGKEDPYTKIGETNDRGSRGDSEYVWALKDINFEVKQGEVLGIIGKNGAGKSTLLKILSKVTGPTTGSIKAKGRIASLLEVGTGFHPELTGRENIYLNGTILGMTKAEVKKKLDEIVEFAGVASYVDTPVKRYSSGMKVRLGFAVAAHLEPEILIVDEVLAVGDAEFQKKAVGKMQEVSHEGGRTVLFVSHNMRSIERLCNKTIVMEDGNCSAILPTNIAISKYFGFKTNALVGQWKNLKPSNERGFIDSVQLICRDNNPRYGCKEEILFRINFFLPESSDKVDINVGLIKGDIKIMMMFASRILNLGHGTGKPFPKGTNTVLFKIPAGLLNKGIYTINALLHNGYMDKIDMIHEAICFEVTENGSDHRRLNITNPGLINLV